jgi:hypothetical protein
VVSLSDGDGGLAFGEGEAESGGGVRWVLGAGLEPEGLGDLVQGEQEGQTPFSWRGRASRWGRPAATEIAACVKQVRSNECGGCLGTMS